MAVTASSSTKLSAVASPVAEAAAAVSDAVEYPEGHWIAQSVWHGDAVRLATAALHHNFRAHDDVLVAMELVAYYEFGNNRAWLQPDVLVAFGGGVGGTVARSRCGKKARPRTLCWRWRRRQQRRTTHGTRRENMLGSGCESTGGLTRKAP